MERGADEPTDLMATFAAAGKEPSAEDDPAARGGRPRSTTRRAIELVALDLFLEKGFDDTTVEEISARAGISRRTFFRYFPSKTAVVWAEFDQEVVRLRDLLAASSPELSLLAAIREAVLSSNDYPDQAIAELRQRMQMMATMPALAASTSAHYDEWVGAVSAFAAQRLNDDPTALRPRAIAYSALGVCRAAFEQWLLDRDSALSEHLDHALTAWMAGFQS